MAGKADNRWTGGRRHHRLHGRRGCRLRWPYSSHNATTAHPHISADRRLHWVRRKPSHGCWASRLRVI